MFEHWDSFYLLIGSAAGALIGLMFVVATLTTHLEQERVMLAGAIFITPVVVHFLVVMVLSGLALAPGVTPQIAGPVVLAVAAAGLAYAIWIGVSLRIGLFNAPHWSDFWCYAVIPGAIYFALAAAGGAILVEPAVGAYGLAGALIALLISAIRNAWDLVTWMAPRQAAAEAVVRTTDGGELDPTGQGS